MRIIITPRHYATAMALSFIQELHSFYATPSPNILLNPFPYYSLPQSKLLFCCIFQITSNFYKN